MNGGASKTPTVEYVPTMEIAIPVAYFLDCPAKRKDIGKTAATPKPVIKKPSNAG